ncbi:MAG: hypothetical protein EOL88_00600 [Bacteroidia bacterium]|nr:hypothetical protein [Bacteroidia bacterium]
MDKETINKLWKKRVKKIWVTAIFITIGIVWIEASIGKWFLSLLGIELSMGEAIVVVVLTNFLYGVIKTLMKYAKKKRTKK